MTVATIIGNNIFSLFETGLSCSILIALSFLVVNNFIIGGWITGTRAIYEYAAIEIGANKPSANFLVTRIAVGPSAPPIIPIAAASRPLNPRARAPKKVINIPIWAAAPRSMVFLLAIRGPKSVVAPMQRNIKQGYISYFIP